MLEFPITINSTEDDTQNQYTKEVLQDLWICLISREASLLARKEVLTGKAKFGILGDGKELPQVAMARAFQKGDFRSGYYRDQTFMFALDLLTVQQYFSQLYADTNQDPFSGGRQMNSHYATPFIDEEGNWLDLTERYNVTSDVSCTAGQMARALGIAQASQKFKKMTIKDQELLTNDGNEVSFVTIGDASTSEGVFWETMNAAAVMKLPMAVCVWDDGYGISVPKKYQTVKNSISKALEGMLMDENGDGIYIATVKGYDYPGLVSTFERMVKKVREEHVPALIHVYDLTQPQGHSTSGSHERYKSKERLQWEDDNDCIEGLVNWILENNLAEETQIQELRDKAKTYVKECAAEAWETYQKPFRELKSELVSFYNQLLQNEQLVEVIKPILQDLNSLRGLHLGEIVANARQLNFAIHSKGVQLDALDQFIATHKEDGIQRYETHLYSETPNAAIKVPLIPKEFDAEPENIPGYQILNRYFEQLFTKDNRFIAFGEDVGQIGDVNQGFAGLQEVFGKDRVFDTGIREWTIMGQAIGLSMRGFKTIAEIQYLDYLIYGLEPLTDDLATLRFRSVGIQHAPAIIRTRGHRLEGIWHAGSPLGMLINSLRGLYICVPRNMVQAAGLYNTLVQGDDPALVIESLNGYRIREKVPSNLGEFTVPLGTPETIIEGEDVTIVTYGSLVRIAEKAATKLRNLQINVELIDVQTLLPFDVNHHIVESIKKTNRVLFLDEDVPGGATAYMMQHVLENQKAYQYLDSQPFTLTAKNHRTPFGTDGDYFTKPNEEDIVEKVYDIMRESNPAKFPFL